MKSLNTMTEPVELLEEKLKDFSVSLEEAPDSMNLSYDTQKATRSAFLEDQRFSSETVCKKCATNYVAQAYKTAEGLLDRELDKMLLDYEEQITDTISELEVLLDACRSPENAETIAQISKLLDVNVVHQAVEEVHSERKASASLEPLQSYLDQIYYEENRLTETCEDNPFLKQLGKLFRYYGYQARSVIDQIRSDGFILCLAVRTTFNLQANAYVDDMLVQPIISFGVHHDPAFHDT